MIHLDKLSLTIRPNNNNTRNVVRPVGKQLMNFMYQSIKNVMRSIDAESLDELINALQRCEKQQVSVRVRVEFLYLIEFPSAKFFFHALKLPGEFTLLETHLLELPTYIFKPLFKMLLTANIKLKKLSVNFHNNIFQYSAECFQWFFDFLKSL